MHYRRLVRSLAYLALLAACWAATATAAVRLPAVIGDNMVLQQGQPVPIWGWADKGEEVTVTVAGQTRTAKAGEDGRWKIVLDKLAVGRPLSMVVKGSSGHSITLKNVLVGEVWVCSGQSNMDLHVADGKDAQREIAAAGYPMIRLFNVVKRPAATPQADCTGDWKQCSPTTTPTFSATALGSSFRTRSPYATLSKTDMCGQMA